MMHFFALRLQGWAQVATALLLVVLSLRPDTAWATHIRAGDIQVKTDTTASPNPRRVFFKLTLYTTVGSSSLEEDETFFFGDGTSSCYETIPRDGAARPIPGNSDTEVNVFYFSHIYPSTGRFTAQFVGENRVGGIVNMSNSVDQSFYITATFTLDPALGRNRSPLLRAPAVDKAAVGQVFLHNPAADDADRDSLVFRLRSTQFSALAVQNIVAPPCAGATGNNNPNPQVSTNYRFPDDPTIAPGTMQVPYNGIPVGNTSSLAIFSINSRDGQITWNAPGRVGFYNVAIVVEEWRRTAAGVRLIGEIIRDMQIIVTATNNLRPTLTIPPDLCVIAGTPITGAITATDGVGTGSTAQTAVSLFAYAGMLPPTAVVSPASFLQTTTGPPTAQGVFTWVPDCSDVARLPYSVVFKAQDNPNPITPDNPPLIDEKTWHITVIGPAPRNLSATNAVAMCGNPNSVELRWSPYQCANATQMYIYRKASTSIWTPSACETGIPASAGYTLIKVLPLAGGVTSYTDSNVAADGTVQGLLAGQTYCYRIYAGFPLPAGGASIASAEACVVVPGRAAMLKNVDVETTSATAGQIAVRWTQPRTIICNTDGVPSYVLSRGEGLNPTIFTPVRAPFTSLSDTSYVDTGLNTQDLQYTYKLEFVRTYAPGDGRPPLREAAPTASSVLTSALPNATGTAIAVSWTYNVPWDNAVRPVAIYRREGGPANPYVRIATALTTATGGTYTDAALRKGENYCYYVQTDGQYAGSGFLSSLLNRSQQRCLVLSTPPCTPVLALQVTNCDSLANLQAYPQASDSYTNRLQWTPGSVPSGCDAAVASYQVYYRPTPTGRLTLLGTTTQTSFAHASLQFLGGCYAVQAVGASGAVSDTSNVACQDNCVFFKLPNIFTPNGDSKNAVFRPKNSSPIRRIHFTAFNRWGVKVFENTTTASDPILINWDGAGVVGDRNASTGKVSSGIYYYLAEVEFADFASTRRTYKGWVEIVR